MLKYVKYYLKIKNSYLKIQVKYPLYIGIKKSYKPYCYTTK